MIRPLVIGVIGTIASGKDTAAEYLSTRMDLPVRRISDPIKEIATQRGISHNRQDLIALGTGLAAEHGDDFLARHLMRDGQDCIITGMRQLGQIEFLRKHANFTLIAVDADPAKRFERAGSRGRQGEAQTLQEFVQSELEENSGDRAQRLFDCMKLADHRIQNNSDLEGLHRKLDALVSLIQQ